jgi:hypothetical protein
VILNAVSGYIKENVSVGYLAVACHADGSKKCGLDMMEESIVFVLIWRLKLTIVLGVRI